MKKRIHYEPLPPEFMQKHEKSRQEMLDKLCSYHALMNLLK